MWQMPEMDTHGEDLLLAGQHVEPGLYREIGTGRAVSIEQEGVLPATLNGRVACYVRIANTWAQREARWRKERHAEA